MATKKTTKTVNQFIEVAESPSAFELKAQALRSLQDEVKLEANNRLEYIKQQIFALTDEAKRIESLSGVSVKMPTSPTDAKEANEAVSNLVSEAYKLIQQAEGIADAWELSFSFNLAYGMGGYYSGADEEWNSSSANC